MRDFCGCGCNEAYGSTLAVIFVSEGVICQPLAVWRPNLGVLASCFPVQCADAEVAAYCTDSYGRISLQEALPFQKILPLAANEEVNRDDSVSSNQG